MLGPVAKTQPDMVESCCHSGFMTKQTGGRKVRPKMSTLCHVESRSGGNLTRFSKLPVLTYFTYAPLRLLENHASSLTGAAFNG